MTIIKGGVTITGFVQFTANYVPDPPTALTATWTSTVTNTVSLQFTPPAYTGSGPVTSYSAVSYPAGFTATVAANTNTIVIPGLPVYTPYVFNIYSTNFAGNSALSTASNIVYSTNGQLIVPTTSVSPPSPVTSLVAIVTATNSTPTPSALITFTPGALGTINGFGADSIVLTNNPTTISTTTNVFTSVSADFDFKIRFAVPSVSYFGYLSMGYVNATAGTNTTAVDLCQYAAYGLLIARKLINYAYGNYSGGAFRFRATKTGSSLVLAVTNDSDIVQQSETVSLSAGVNYKLFFSYVKDTNNDTQTGTILTDTGSLYAVSAPNSYYTIADVNGTVSVTTTTNSTVITGLNPLTSYTFNASATNLGGTSVLTTSNTITTLVASSSTAYIFPGSYTWVAPANVTSVAVVAVGAGGGGTFGSSINGSCYVAGAGGQSYFGATCVVRAYGGNPGSSNYSGGTGGTGRSGTGNTAVVAAGGTGGTDASARGGGAAGYAGVGGGAGNTNGTGGAGGGGAINAAGVKGGGGGVGLFGQGCSGGAGGTGSICDPSGTGGSGGVAGRLVGNVGYGGVFGGGGAGAASGAYNSGAGGAGGGLAYINNYTVTPSQGYTVVVGGGGAGRAGGGYCGGPGGGGGVRIVWPGQLRSFPSTALTSCASIASTYVPSTPGITSVTANSGTSISLVYTAPTYTGGSVITSYTAVSSDGVYSTTTATAAAGVIVIYGLQPLTSYSFAVYATNSYGNSLNSGYLSATTYVASSSTAYTFPGTYTWIAPANVTSVSALAVGGGSAAQIYFSGCYRAASVGGQSYFYNTSVVAANGGSITGGGAVVAGTGGAGGAGGGVSNIGGCGVYGQGAGGGAGGYTAAGGAGAGGQASAAGAASTGGGGGGGSNSYYNNNYASGGGGVGLFGLVGNGPGGAANYSTGIGSGGGGGSGGLSGTDHGPSGTPQSGPGGLFGGGGGSYGPGTPRNTSVAGGGGGGLAYSNNIAVTPGNSYTVVVGAGGTSYNNWTNGGGGAVRIVWPGAVRSFPSTMVGQGWDGATTTTTYIPQSPTAVSAIANSGTSISVVYSAPTYSGGATITSYTAVDSSGLISATTSTAASGVIVLSGLLPLTTYSFTVYATNQYGKSLPSNTVSTATYIANSSTAYTFPGSYTWIAPANVTAVSAVVVGGGGGGSYGGASGSPGGLSYFISVSTVAATPGAGAQAGVYGGAGGAGGGVCAGVGYSGGSGGTNGSGGGAGGYTAAGGAGGSAGGAGTTSAGDGGGGGGYNSTTGIKQGGGGVGLFGAGAQGAGGLANSSGVGVAGGGGACGAPANGTAGGTFGGGGAGTTGGGGGGALAYINNISVSPSSNYTVVVGSYGPIGPGGPGAVRLVWPGQVRSFPSTMVATRYETGLTTSSFYVPSTPAITSVTVNSGTMISVAYIAPTYNGGAAPSSYTAIVNPGNITASTATSAGGVIPVYGLTPLTTYSVSVYATNQYGSSAASSAVTTSTLIANGEVVYTAPGSYTWVAPANVKSVSVVAVGGGAGGVASTILFGSTSQSNGQDSYFGTTAVLLANGGTGSYFSNGGSRTLGSGGAPGGGYTGGGTGGTPGGRFGGGAGGYSGNGGSGTGGSGGNGGCLANVRAAGGGVGLYGLGASGANGSTNGICSVYGQGGSGGNAGSSSGGGLYGGGGAGSDLAGCHRGGGGGGGALAYRNDFAVTPGTSYTVFVGGGGYRSSNDANSHNDGAGGAVRIIWPGSGRLFPSTVVTGS